MDSRVFAYCRVSTKEQNLDRQITAIKEYAKRRGIYLPDDRIITDKESGKDFNRQGYTALMHSSLGIRNGDTLIIKELDRLSRDYDGIKTEWKRLIDMGVEMIVIDTLILNTANKSTLEKTLISNIVFELMAYLAEKERMKIKQRQAEGIRNAKLKGVKLGRPAIHTPSNWDEVFSKWERKEITAVCAMKLLNLKPNTFYKMVQGHKKAAKP
ncbi:MAG: recombinase family protein [Bacteroidales bacterium]|nr:recombinase family protein [Bacteroidales bacterium]